MRSLSFLFCILAFSLAGRAAVEADPAKLRPSTADTQKAEALVQKLASEVFQERDDASRDLAAMGRLALPVVEKILAETDDAEVRSLCEALKPAMAADDLKARMGAFVADADGKYDHRLPSWKEFREITGNTAAARTQFAQFFENAAAAKLLTASAGAKEEFAAAVVARRMEIYNRMYGRVIRPGNGVVFSSTERVQPTALDAAAQLFCETIAGTTGDRRYSYAISNMLQNGGEVRNLIIDDTKGEILRKLLKAWSDSRTETAEVYTAMTIVGNLKLKDIPVAPYAKKILEAKITTPFYKGYALTSLAQHRGKENLDLIVKQFEDTTTIQTAFVNPQGQVERVEMQVRDVALAMAVLTTEQKPEDYGLVARNGADANKYSYNNYRFESDTKRDAGFKKWTEWRTKNPK